MSSEIIQRNIAGNISNVKGSINIGDNIIQPEKQFPKELTSKLPRLNAEKIIGRTKDLEDVYARLFDNKQVVLVNGMGGIGKTTLAQVYLTQYYDHYKHIAWIGLSLDGGKFQEDFVNTAGLLKQFDVHTEGKDSEKLFTKLILSLKGLAKDVPNEKPCLLIIDNANQSLSELYDNLPNQPNWHLLVTSREKISPFYVKELGFLTKEEAIQLFKFYYKWELKKADLEQLVKELEYHTLTIEILAKTAQRRRTTPKELFDAIQKDLTVEVDIRHSSNTGQTHTLIFSTFNK